MAGAEDEPPAVAQRRPDRGRGRPQLVVGHQALEGVARHRRQVELAVPGGFGGRAGDPLDVGTAPRPVQHRRVGIEPDQPAGVPEVAGVVQHAPGAAAHVQDGAGRHHPRGAEGHVGAVGVPGVQHVVEGRDVGVGEHCGSIDRYRHRGRRINGLPVSSACAM